MVAKRWTDAELAAANVALQGQSPQEVLRWAVRYFHPRLTMATAFGAEGCCLLHMLAEIEPAVHAEYFMGYDERRQAWVRFGVMSTGQYFAIRMTETGDSGWSWKYVSFFRTQNPETPGSDATFTKKSDSEYAVDGPSYEQNGTRVTEHHVCKKV